MKRERVLCLMLACGAIGLAAIGAHARPAIIYNPSNSVPTGFYARLNDAPQRGDFVTVAAASVAPKYAALRGYADATDHFLKRVAAAQGQVVCAEGATISVDGVRVASRSERDRVGRLLPTWRGCHTLAADEVFLLGDTDDSFDGRYWGPTPMLNIEGVWARL